MSIFVILRQGKGGGEFLHNCLLFEEVKKISIIFFELKFKFCNYNLSDENELLGYQITQYMSIKHPMPID